MSEQFAAVFENADFDAIGPRYDARCYLKGFLQICGKIIAFCAMFADMKSAAKRVQIKLHGPTVFDHKLCYQRGEVF